jgi:hypothetical protein
MRVYVESVWNCDPNFVWDKVQQSATLLTIAWPLIRICPVGTTAFPQLWQRNTTVACKLYLLGFIPLGTRFLTFERIDAAQREIQTREYDLLVRRWDHLIRVESAGPARARYSDTIEVEAGPLTLPVWLFANAFYRYRQWRWRSIASQCPAL